LALRLFRRLRLFSTAGQPAVAGLSGSSRSCIDSHRKRSSPLGRLAGLVVDAMSRTVDHTDLAGSLRAGSPPQGRASAFRSPPRLVLIRLGGGGSRRVGAPVSSLRTTLFARSPATCPRWRSPTTH
jgi:hypothetical protein